MSLVNATQRLFSYSFCYSHNQVHCEYWTQVASDVQQITTCVLHKTKGEDQDFCLSLFRTYQNEIQ